MATIRRLAGVLIAATLSLAVGVPPAFATYGGMNGKIAYTDIVDKGTPDARRAVFLDPGGQFTHPIPYGSGANDNDTDPAWSPDGKQLAFIRRNGQTQRYGIHAMNADGTGLRLVAGEFNANGTPTYLNGATPSGLAWSPDGLRIGFFARGLIASVAAIGGPTPSFSVPLNNPFSASPINGFDWGPDGFLYRCSVLSVPNTKFCSADTLGSVKSVTTIAPSEAALHAGFLGGIPRWRPDGQGGQTVMFLLTYSQTVGGQSVGLTGVFSLRTATFWNGDNYGTDLVRHTPAEEKVSCTNTTNGVTTTTFGARYGYSNPVPSPDGRFFVVRRVETVTTTTPEGKCAFKPEGHGLYLLRESGFQQRTVVASTDADDVAWQPSPANLAVRINDGHGNQLDGLQVDLRAELGGAVVDGEPVNTAGGIYNFSDIPPGNYRVRATLREKDGGGFDVRHEFPALEPVWAEAQVTVSATDGKKEVIFPFAVADNFVDASVPDHLDRLDDMAVIYYNTRKFVEWVRANLTENTGALVNIYTFSPQSPNGSVDDMGGAIYNPQVAGIFLNVANSEWENRDGILDGSHDDDAPLNVEWHEFSHHLGTQVHPDQYCALDIPPRISHAGYRNRTTCDSMVEGFATFLPAWATRNPDYSGIANLESSLKAWGSRFRGGGLDSLEDMAVAGLLWDIVDSNADADYSVAIAYNGLHLPVTYSDDVSLSLTELWAVLKANSPRTVAELQDALALVAPFTSLTVDLDNDGVNDVSQIDPLFLMHGFFPVYQDQVISAGHQSWHYNVANARLNGPPGTQANADVGLSSHYAYTWPGQVSGTFIPRDKIPVSPGANLAIQLRDASGSPLQAGDLEMTLHYPGSDQVITRHLGSGASNLVHLELPVYFDYELPIGAPLPECAPATDLYISVTVRATVNGYTSADLPAFDNCQYLQAMTAASGPAALSYTLNFPEDGMAPVTAIAATASGPVVGDYTAGFWWVALSCQDPVDGVFASGCWRIEYSIDGGPYLPYAEVVKVAEPGLHTFSYRSLDAAGNEENARTVNLGVAAYVETQPPVTTPSAEASGPVFGAYTDGYWTITLSCFDPPSATGTSGCQRIEYNLDGTGFVTYQDGVVLDQQGLHTLQYRSIDLAGNVEALQSFALGVAFPDTTPPYSDYYATAEGPAFSSGDDVYVMGLWRVSLAYCDDEYLAPEDQARSGCAYAEYSLDGSPFLPFDGEVIISEAGLHTFQFHSIDEAGNVEDLQSLTLGVAAPSDVDGDGVLDPSDNCVNLANADQRDTNGDGFGNRCDPDFNNNGITDSQDGALLKAAFGQSGFPDRDLNGNGIVDSQDGAILKSFFGKAPGPRGAAVLPGD